MGRQVNKIIGYVLVIKKVICFVSSSICFIITTIVVLPKKTHFVFTHQHICCKKLKHQNTKYILLHNNVVLLVLFMSVNVVVLKCVVFITCFIYNIFKKNSYC